MRKLPPLTRICSGIEALKEAARRAIMNVANSLYIAILLRKSSLLEEAGDTVYTSEISGFFLLKCKVS